MIFDPLVATFQGFAIAVGLVIGSFLNVCIVRMPEDRSVVWPGSHCDRCGEAIRPRDNIPVLSYVLLRGRCRNCQAPIPAFHPMIELLGGLVSWLMFRRFVTSPADLDPAHLAAWATYFGFACLLIVASFVDLKHKIIPDQTSSYAVPFAIAAATATHALGYHGWLALDLKSSIAGAVFGGGMLAFFAVTANALYAADALGWGDVKLAALIGAFLGAMPGTLLAVLMGSVIGAIVGVGLTVVLRRRVLFAYGPPLAIGALLYVLYGDVLMRAFFPGLAAWLPPGS